MRRSVPIVLTSCWLLSLAVPSGAQTTGQLSLPARGSANGSATTGTAATPTVQPAAKPAPRQPVSQAASGHGQAAATANATTEPPQQALPLPLPPKPPAQPPPAKADGKPEPAEKPLQAEKPTNPEKPDNGAAKVPRFASLRSEEVNMRSGPGTRYRIEWVYKRRDLPVEIEREFDVWRFVRDPDGVEGWMQQATLMGRRTFIVQNADATIRSSPKDTSSPVALLKIGVIGRIRSCDGTTDWCEVQAGGYRGYLRRDQFWGTLPHETISP